MVNWVVVLSEGMPDTNGTFHEPATEITALDAPGLVAEYSPPEGFRLAPPRVNVSRFPPVELAGDVEEQLDGRFPIIIGVRGEVVGPRLFAERAVWAQHVLFGVFQV